MVTFIFTPPAGSGTPSIEFSRDTTDYTLLRAYSGISELSTQQNTVTYYGQQGSTWLSTTANPRKVELVILIRADSIEQLQSRVHHLVNCINPLLGQGTLNYTRNDGTSYFIKAIADNSPKLDTTAAGRGLTWQRATVTFVAHNPMWSTAEQYVKQLSIYIKPMFLFQFPFEVVASTNNQVIKNSGSMESWPLIEILGAVENVKITNSEKNQTISFTVDMAANDVLRINTDPDNRYCTYFTQSTGVTTTGWRYMDLASQIWSLSPGWTNVTVQKDTAAVGSSVSIYWANRYVGV